MPVAQSISLIFTLAIITDNKFNKYFFRREILRNKINMNFYRIKGKRNPVQPSDYSLSIEVLKYWSLKKYYTLGFLTSWEVDDMCKLSF